MTYTYALIPVSKAYFDEVKSMMEAAGYHHAFNTHDGKPVLDMRSLALIEDDGKIFNIRRYNEGNADVRKEKLAKE